MPPKKRRVKKRKNKRHIIFVLFLVVVCIFLFFEESGKDNTRNFLPGIFKAGPKAKHIPSKKAPSGGLLKVSIVMDDLGPNKSKAETVLAIKAPLTLSILPHETYSVWIAEEGHRLGHDIIAHVPMEAITPHKLGKGALQTWMTDSEITDTLSGDIRSIPHISGISNHMGSAFTKDERAMRAFFSELKKYRLFFLDSVTISESKGYRLAKEEGLAALRRDVFLDNKDDLHEIEVQWKRLLKISREKGYAIALAHPRKKTLEFLQKKLENNKEVTVVPITELITD
ncbi:divergent polysaccharide deacetylase [bacterium BMS3Bbin09]|nr:divergent polysaccharide deacetylase [bacterium BMS3Bbin09]